MKFRVQRNPEPEQDTRWTYDSDFRPVYDSSGGRHGRRKGLTITASHPTLNPRP